jgi:predicted PurR-regulated permease PerM
MNTNRHGFDTRLSIGFLLLLTGVGFYLSFLIARPFLAPIVTATLLAVAIQPLFAHLLRYVQNRNAAAILTTAMMFLALLLPAIIVVNTLASETMALYTWLDQRSSSTEGWSEYLSRLTARPLGWIEAKTGVSREQLRSAALGQLRNVSVWLVNWAKSLALNVTGTIVSVVIIFFTLFFLLRDGHSILEHAGAILPLEPQRYNVLMQTITDSIVANIYGVVAVSFSQGVLGALGYWIAGLPNVMLWSVMTALFSMIPIAGAIAVWGAGVVYLLTIAHWGRAIFLLAYGTAVISMADNIVRPIVLSGRVKMNTLLIFFSLLGGVQAFGIVGLFVGPIIVSVTTALVKMLAAERLRWNAADKNPDRTDV